MLNFPKVPLDSWTEKYPGYSYDRFGHFRPFLCFSSRWPIGRFWAEQASDEPAEQRKLFIIQATHDLVWERQAWRGVHFNTRVRKPSGCSRQPPFARIKSSLISIAAGWMNRWRCIFTDVDPEIFNLIDPLCSIRTIFWHLRQDRDCEKKHFDGLVNLIRWDIFQLDANLQT